MIRWGVTSVALALCLSLPVQAGNDRWHIEDFGTTDVGELGDIAFNSYSTDTKARIRSYILGNAPNTAEGLLAGGWLKGKDGDSAGELVAYRQCVAKFPEALNCLSNLAYKTPDLSEKESTFNKLLEMAPDFVDFAPVRNMYFLLLEDRKDHVTESGPINNAVPDAMAVALRV